MIAKVSNLVDQIQSENKALLYCKLCGAEYSANKGDYWDLPEDKVITCCGEPMTIVTKVISYRPVKRQ